MNTWQLLIVCISALIALAIVCDVIKDRREQEPGE